MSGFGISDAGNTSRSGIKKLELSQTVHGKSEEEIYKTKDDLNKDNSSLVTGLTLDNFKAAMIKKYAEDNDGKEVEFKDIPNSLIKENFALLLSGLSDKEKSMQASSIITEFKDKSCLIQMFFESFQDKAETTKCADSIDSSMLLKEEYSEILKTITKHMSVPGTNRLFESYEEKFYNYYHTNQELIDKVFKNNVPEESLTEDEQKIINEYKRLAGIGTKIAQASLENENFTPEDSENLINRINDFYKESYFYQEFLENMASFISNSENKLSLSKEKLESLLDKISDSQYSKTAQIVNSKSSLDTETGNFKVPDENIIVAAKQQQSELLQRILKETPNEEGYVVAQTLPDTTFEPVYESTGFLNFKDLKNIVTSNQNSTKSEENAALNSYKKMSAANQVLLFTLGIKGTYFEEFLNIAKTPTIQTLNSIGFKADTVANTNKIEDELNEKKKKAS